LATERRLVLLYLLLPCAPVDDCGRRGGHDCERGPVQQALLGQFERFMGTTGAEAMAKMLQSAGHSVDGSIATVVSLVTLFVVSMAMFSELQDALNLIWKIPSQSTSAALWGLLRTRLLSFLLSSVQVFFSLPPSS
jgi:uncharacterized BrkB/YihY/UPF0761 family membrane protein